MNEIIAERHSATFLTSSAKTPAPYGRILIAVLAVCTVCSIFQCTALGQTDSPDLRMNDDKLILGFTRNVFTGVHVPDALAAMKIWATEIKRTRGLSGPVETKVFDSVSDAQSAVENRLVDLIILSTSEYLNIQCKPLITPHYVHVKSGQITEDYLLLVHQSSSDSSLDQLEKKNLLLMKDTGLSMGIIWLENLLFKKGFRRIEDYFGSIKQVEKTSGAVLPVFFKKEDACLIRRGGFEMMADLNPQINKQLKIIDSSPPTIASVTCVRNDYTPNLKEVLIDALGELQDELRGQQILMLFKIEKLVPFKDSYLDSARELLDQHRMYHQEFMDNNISAEASIVDQP